MDMSQFKKEFIDEAVKQSDVINNSLKNLDSKTLTELSRAAHILKSSSATMGYMQLSKLSKAMEETLNEIISKKIEITSMISNVLTESFNALLDLIKAIREDKKERDVSELITKLKRIV